MTVEELVERIRKHKNRIREITVEQAIACNLVYEKLGCLPISVNLLDKSQSQLSEMILKGGDGDEARRK